MKKNLGVLGIWLASMFGALMSPAAVAADPYTDNPAQLIAAAKKEGALTWYTSLAPTDSAQIIKRFEEKYGIKVTVWRSGDDNVLQRIVTESNGKTYKVDVAQIQTDNMEALSQEKMLMTVDSPSYPDLIPGAVAPHHQWAIAQITLYVLAYNTNLIKKEDLPKTYKDLQDPKWKGKLGVESTDSIWLHVVSQSLGGDAGLAFFRQLKAQNDLSVRTGHSLLANMVAAGEVPMALNVYQYKAIQLKRGGAPVDWLALDPALAFTTSVGMLKNAPHPNAARLFYEFMLKEGQEVMASIDDIPSNTKVASPLKGTKVTFMDSATALKNRKKWEDTFNDVIIKR